MKGDFSFLAFDTEPHYSGVLHQQGRVLLDRDWNGMIGLGGNIYFTSKIAATDGLSFQQIAAIMSGVTQPEYAQMMLDGGRSIEGNRSKKDRPIG